MATYNEIHPNMSGENHNALYMVVGIILALMIAGFAFYYYTDGGSSAQTNNDASAGTVVERVIEPSSGSTNGSASTENNATETNRTTLDLDDGSVTTSTTRSSN